ncbi:MAG TPA: hypothetical protein VF699_01250 [Caulobacteraceae bacterium]|jgi:hypothetical protein
MKRLLTAAAIALAAGLAACATATPYQPAQLTAAGPQNGFYEVPLEQNRWRVTFAGNSLTSRQQVEDSLLLRAAELTLQQGFDHFVAVNRATERDVTYRADPDPFFSSSRYAFGGYPYWSPRWRYYRPAYGWRYMDPFYDPFWGSSFGRSSYDVREIDRYEASAEIMMGRGPAPADARAFDARQIVQNLGPRIPRPVQPGYQQPYAQPYPRTY